MNKIELVHQERKEFWRGRLAQYAASGKSLDEWCKENGVCQSSMNRWRLIIWREEEAAQEIEANREWRRKKSAEQTIGSLASDEDAGRNAQMENQEKVREENSFVEISPVPAEGEETVTIISCEKMPRTRSKRKSTTQKRDNKGETRQIAAPDAIVGYRDYVIGVYEHTSSQMLQKIVEVLRYA